MSQIRYCYVLFLIEKREVSQRVIFREDYYVLLHEKSHAVKPPSKFPDILNKILLCLI